MKEKESPMAFKIAKNPGNRVTAHEDGVGSLKEV